MPRTSDYEINKIQKQVRITATAISAYSEYAEALQISFSELIEQIARYPSVGRGFAAFTEKYKKGIDKFIL